jgi:hypothetical protein
MCGKRRERRRGAACRGPCASIQPEVFFAATQTAKKSGDAASRGIARSIDVTDGRTHTQQGSFVSPRENDNIFLIVLERITLEQLHNPEPVLSQGLRSERLAVQEGLLVARIGRGIGPASNYL